MTHTSLLLIGSPHYESTSGEIGGYLQQELSRLGWSTESLRIYQSLKEPHFTELAGSFEEADLVILTFPLYVDAIPAAMTAMMERLAGRPKNGDSGRRRRLVALVNSGFPEARQNETALAVCRRFALETGLEWAGGLALGGGGIVNGRPLEQLGGMVRHIVEALTQTAKALDQGEQVPVAASRLMGRQTVPGWVMALVGGMMWRAGAKQHGAQRRLKARPYEK